MELGGVGPVPFAGMVLSDLGAEVIRLQRPAGYDGGAPIDGRFDLMLRGRQVVELDLKNPTDVEYALALCDHADVVLEGFRPGVAERLGLGPDVCSERNPRLVYGRMTGWGQTGPMSSTAGHDVNYIGLTGALHAIGEADRGPVVPLNLVGDIGGGALYLVIGVLAALREAERSGRGQVVDAAMVDGAANMMTLFYGLFAAGYWQDERGANRLDSGAPWYGVYATSDGRWISLAANESRFWRNLLALVGISDKEFPDQHDRSAWPALRQRLEQIFRTKTRAEWCAAAATTDVCIAPVLSLEEAPTHPHLVERQTFVEIDGIVQPAPAPRFSRTPGRIQGPPAQAARPAAELLAAWSTERSAAAGPP